MSEAKFREFWIILEKHKDPNSGERRSVCLTYEEVKLLEKNFKASRAAEIGWAAFVIPVIEIQAVRDLEVKLKIAMDALGKIEKCLVDDDKFATYGSDGVLAMCISQSNMALEKIEARK